MRKQVWVASAIGGITYRSVIGCISGEPEGEFGDAASDGDADLLHGHGFSLSRSDLAALRRQDLQRTPLFQVPPVPLMISMRMGEPLVGVEMKASPLGLSPT